MARGCKAHTTKFDWVYGTCRACAENYCAEVIFPVILNKQRCLLRGYRFLSNKDVMEKLEGHRFFSVKNIGISTWNKLEIITIFYWNLCSMTTPCKLSTLRSMGVVLLVYDNTAVPMGCHTIFDYQIRGSQNIAEVRLELMNPLFQSMVTS